MAQGILNLSSALANLELLTSKDLKELNIGIKFPDDPRDKFQAGDF